MLGIYCIYLPASGSTLAQSLYCVFHASSFCWEVKKGGSSQQHQPDAAMCMLNSSSLMKEIKKKKMQVAFVGARVGPVRPHLNLKNMKCHPKQQVSLTIGMPQFQMPVGWTCIQWRMKALPLSKFTQALKFIQLHAHTDTCGHHILSGLTRKRSLHIGRCHFLSHFLCMDSNYWSSARPW